MVWEVRSGGSDTLNSGGFAGGALVSTPSAPSVAISSGGSVANATYYVVVTHNDGYGETPISGESSVVSSPPDKADTKMISSTSPSSLI